ncbi:MAG TPA: FAD-dependent monooxygenase [Xanthobacteraceae bacterium]|jgi:2-polyprenyl-6-methoxyphenol hydroxylase-like FAD-dependent oxidoreductase|nr:FAD-dependent monooxygenase [Xanthobacteraceae bacterium]
MSKNRQRRALIVGGSMTGLLAGITLMRRGWSVDIYERAEKELAGRGAGIVAQPELIARLQALGLNTHNLGVAMSRRQILDPTGAVTVTRDCPQVMTAWERVYRVLRDAFPADHYHRDRGLSDFKQNGEGVTAHFSDGSTTTADVMIGADGLRSTVRQQCLPDTHPLYAGYVAWRGLLLESAIPRELFMIMTFCLPPGEQCLGYPVTGAENALQEGQRRYNLIWYRPADETKELPRLLTDKNGTVHSVSIPPPLIAPEPIAAMRAAAERLLAPQLRTVIRSIDEPILQPIYDLESSRLAFGRVGIIGDAAFVARPHVGAGVSKAADDATALALALDDDDIESGLRRFEAERLLENRKIIERARHLGAYLQATQTAEERARSARHSIPEAVLAETALLDFPYG